MSENWAFSWHEHAWCRTEGLSWNQQAQLYSEASLVIQAHGAALGMLGTSTSCLPHCQLHEVMQPGHAALSQHD